MTVNVNNGIDLIIPSKGEKNWDLTMLAAFQALSGHSHEGGGDGVNLSTNAIANLAITTAKINDLAVTTGKIAAGAVTVAKMSLDANLIPTGNLTVDIGNTSSPSLIKQLSVRDVFCANNDMAIGTTTSHNVNFRYNNQVVWSLIGGVLTGNASNGDDLTFNRALKGPRVTVAQVAAAAGASQGTATAITANIVTVTSGSGGVRLPAPNGTGHRINVYNDLAGSLNIYPATGGTIGGAGTNNPVSVGTKKSMVFEAYSAGDWIQNLSA